MLKPLKEIGLKKALKFLLYAPLQFLFDLLLYPPLRVLFLRMLGAKIGKNVVMGKASFANLYRTGFKGLKIGDCCVIDDFVLFDLADEIELGSHVTIAWNALLITHMNVGYKDHPLQEFFPPTQGKIIIKKGTFVGARATILNGVTVGEKVYIAAGSLIHKDTEDGVLMAGIPAEVKKKL